VCQRDTCTSRVTTSDAWANVVQTKSAPTVESVLGTESRTQGPGREERRTGGRDAPRQEGGVTAGTVRYCDRRWLIRGKGILKLGAIKLRGGGVSPGHCTRAQAALAEPDRVLGHAHGHAPHWHSIVWQRRRSAAPQRKEVRPYDAVGCHCSLDDQKVGTQRRGTYL